MFLLGRASGETRARISRTAPCPDAREPGVQSKALPLTRADPVEARPDRNASVSDWSICTRASSRASPPMLCSSRRIVTSAPGPAIGGLALRSIQGLASVVPATVVGGFGRVDTGFAVACGRTGVQVAGGVSAIVCRWGLVRGLAQTGGAGHRSRRPRNAPTTVRATMATVNFGRRELFLANGSHQLLRIMVTCKRTTGCSWYVRDYLDLGH